MSIEQFTAERTLVNPEQIQRDSLKETFPGLEDDDIKAFLELLSLRPNVTELTMRNFTVTEYKPLEHGTGPGVDRSFSYRGRVEACVNEMVQTLFNPSGDEERAKNLVDITVGLSAAAPKTGFTGIVVTESPEAGILFAPLDDQFKGTMGESQPKAH